MENKLKSLEGFTGIWIPAELSSDKNLSALEMLVFAEIYALTKNDKGYCYASNKYIGWRLREMSVSSVSNCISRLEKKKYISVKCIKSEKGLVTERQIRVLKPPTQNVETPAQNVDTPPAQNVEVIDNSIIDNNKDNKEQPFLKLLPTQQEKNSKRYVENTVLALMDYYKEATKAIHQANDDPLPNKYSDYKQVLKEFNKIGHTPVLVEQIKNHLENITLSARRAERFREWQSWENFFRSHDYWEGSEELEARLKFNVFVPYIKRFDRYLAEKDWHNVYLKMHETFWNMLTEEMIEPTQKEIDRAGIQMTLIKDLDFIQVSIKEYKQMSF
jgi:hypothetical protein